MVVTPKAKGKTCPTTTQEFRKAAWTRMLSNICQMIVYQNQAVKLLSFLAARPMIRGRLLRVSALSEVLRTPAEVELAMEDARRCKTRTAVCQHRYENGQTALKKHGGKVVTAHCQLPGCDYRMRKMPDGSWEEWPREAPRSRVSSACSPQSRPSSAPTTRPTPPWARQNRTLAEAQNEDQEDWDQVMVEEEPPESEESDP